MAGEFCTWASCQLCGRCDDEPEGDPCEYCDRDDCEGDCPEAYEAMAVEGDEWNADDEEAI